jgi:hypothetical protein
MPEIWSGWSYQIERADRAMVSSLRRGAVPCRGDAYEQLFPDLPIVRPRTDKPIALQAVIAGLLVLRIPVIESDGQATLAEYEATETEFVFVPFGGMAPAPVKKKRTAVLVGEELAWDALREDLIRFELQAGLDHGRRKGKGRIPHPIWKNARDVAMRWLKDNGCPEHGDLQQKNLEEDIASWLYNRGHDPAVSTIRAHVVRWISEYRELNSLG